ncbi:MAG TPA: hypothetical protein VF992_00085 [Thermoplasmata archaeon]
MALIPDLAVATLYAAVVFLLVLGVLIIFVETVRPSHLRAVLAADFGLVGFLVIAGEGGVALLVLAVAGSFVANHVFEWLTTR